MLVRERAERLLVVIRDRVETNACGFELRLGVAQLDELRPARGSPHGGAEEDDDRLRAVAIGVEVDRAAVLIGQYEVGQLVADLGAGRVAVGQTDAAGMSERRGRVEAVVVAFDCHAEDLVYPLQEAVPVAREDVPLVGLAPDFLDRRRDSMESRGTTAARVERVVAWELACRNG